MFEVVWFLLRNMESIMLWRGSHSCHLSNLHSVEQVKKDQNNLHIKVIKSDEWKIEVQGWTFEWLFETLQSLRLFLYSVSGNKKVWTCDYRNGTTINDLGNGQRKKRRRWIYFFRGKFILFLEKGLQFFPVFPSRCFLNGIALLDYLEFKWGLTSRDPDALFPKYIAELEITEK